MRLAGALLLAGALFALAEPAAGAPSDSAQVLAAVRAADLPVRDLAELSKRVPVRQIPVQPAGPDSLWVLDVGQRTYRAVPVELRHSSQHADWYFERGRPSGDLMATVDSFEARIFPRVSELTGATWTPGSNGQRRLAIYNGQIGGVGGYVSSNDAEPRGVFPFSNERLIVYLSLDSVRPGTDGYNATLAHELEHLAHSVINPGQQGWVDEGLADLVANLVMGGAPPGAAAFRGSPDVQLNAWSEKPWEAQAHYQASHLWARYLMERGGGPAALPSFIGAGGQGFQTAERYAVALGQAGGAEGLFRDWLVANLVGNSALEDGRFGYGGSSQRSAAVATLTPSGGVVEERVHQFAADYYRLSTQQPVDLRIEVSPTVRLIDTDDAHGAFFWSVRGDSADTRLTRGFDLSGLDRATLRYRIWHALEADYDFCYVLASPDGTSWQPLAGRWTTEPAQAGVALGPGYSGPSGSNSGWLEEEIDLNAFAGGPLELRFECVTDQGYSGPGFAVDEVAIPELAFSDDVEVDRGWQAEGFVRAANRMAQPALVLLVEEFDDALSIRELPLDDQGRGRLAVDPAGGALQTHVIVAGLAPATLEQMPYRLWLEAPPGR